MATVGKEKAVPVVDDKQEAPQPPKEAAKAEAAKAEAVKVEAAKAEASEIKPPEPKAEPEAKGESQAPYYLVREGDSLSTIAERTEGYKDPLKWIILLRFNLEALSRLPETPDFAESKLAPGTKLKIVVPKQSTGGAKDADGRWVANVLSARSNEEVVPLAVRLARKGFPVYLTRAHAKGQEWMRLRVGFFSGRSKAQEAGRKIKEAVQVGDPWIIRAGKEEYDEFAGFLEMESGS